MILLDYNLLFWNQIARENLFFDQKNHRKGQIAICDIENWETT